MRKLRLLVTEKCNRSCAGCCNKDWDLKQLPVCSNFRPYGLIMITGGEPMLEPTRVLALIHRLRVENPDAKIVIYTAWNGNYDERKKRILQAADGITFTVHEHNDWKSALLLDQFFAETGLNKSLRLNIFREAEIPKDTLDQLSCSWEIKPDIEWIENCPLPENEVFMRIGRNK